jgi:hypothetical protein
MIEKGLHNLGIEIPPPKTGIAIRQREKKIQFGMKR